MRLPITVALATALVALAGCSKDPAPAEGATSASSAQPASPVAEEATPPATAPPEAVFSQAELDQMVAPIALYPDPLLAQVLMASTYPGDVADAAKWSEAHPDATGDAAVKQVAAEPWDPSVQSLVAFPQALATLQQDPAWVQNLGDAFLAQPDAVMDAVQRLRHQAQDAGNLESNEYQSISTEQAEPPAEAAPDAGGVTVAPAQATTETIIIQPSDPEVVYVPSYNPTTTYGTWAYPSYPPPYYPPPQRYYDPGAALVSGMAFGVGVAVVDSLWGEPNWGYHGGYWGHGGGGNYIDVDVNRYNNINSNNRIDRNSNSWQHNAVNRDGVPYRDSRSRQEYGRHLDGSEQRTAFRGDDAKRTQERENARKSIEQHGMEAPARSNTEARARAQEATRDRGNVAAARTGAGTDRDQARERAKAATDRAQASPQSRERAQAAANKAKANPQSRERAQAAASKAKANPQQARAKAAQRSSKPTTNTQARQAAKTQHAQRAAPQNNAFKGASRPSASHAQAARGHASQSHAQRPPASRSSSRPQQVKRPSHPPQHHAQRGGRR